MGRFEREAQVLASLNHPNIAAIYGLEENGGQRALVMELASGEELATRIARGKIPLEEALRIALEIAEALEAAHDKGIIHRDLKPANIKLGTSGSEGSAGSQVKILDFGLAKALQGDLASSSGDRPHAFADAVGGGDAGGDDPGHGRVHEPGAGAGVVGRSPRRHLVVRRHPLRADVGPARVHRRHGGRHAGQGDRARAGLVAPTGVDAAGDQEPDRALPGQEPAAATAGDRRRAAGARGDAREPGAAAVGRSRRRRSRSRRPTKAKSRRAASAAIVPWAIAALALAVAGCFAFAGPRGGGSDSRRCRRCRSRSRSEARSSTSAWARASRCRRTARSLVYVEGNDVAAQALRSAARSARAHAAQQW